MSALPSFAQPPASTGRRAPVGTVGARRVERSCARPACAAEPGATLRFAYAEREAWLDVLAARSEPGAYDLCLSHAARTRPPHGWQLRDRRPRDPAVGATMTDPGGVDVAPAAPGPTPAGPDGASEGHAAPLGVPGVGLGAFDDAPAGPIAPVPPSETVTVVETATGGPEPLPLGGVTW